MSSTGAQSEASSSSASNKSANNIDTDARLETLFNLGDQIVARANNNEQIEAIVVSGSETEVRVYNGEIEQFTAATSQGIGIRVISDNRQGYAWAGSLDPELIDVTLAEARDNATFSTADQYLGLAEPDGVSGTDTSLFDPALLEFDTDAKIELALELEKMSLQKDARIIGTESTDYADSISEAVVVSTTGIRRGGIDGGAYVSSVLLANQDEDTQIGFGYSVNRNPYNLDIEKAADMSVERAVRLLGATKPESGRFTVVLDPMVTAQILGIVGSTMSGLAALKGRSLFGDRLGTKIASDVVTLIDDPTNPKAFTATEIDGEGLATRRKELISNGQFNTFLHNAYTARRSNTISTGNAVRGFISTPSVGHIALALEPGQRQQADLIAGISDGVLIQGLYGLHSGVNPVSGDFSTGASGIKIRNGELAEPLREFTIASTLQKILLDISEVGADVDWLPGSASGVSLVIDSVSVSGQ